MAWRGLDVILSTVEARGHFKQSCGIIRVVTTWTLVLAPALPLVLHRLKGAIKHAVPQLPYL